MLEETLDGVTVTESAYTVCDQCNGDVLKVQLECHKKFECPARAKKNALIVTNCTSGTMDISEIFPYAQSVGIQVRRVFVLFRLFLVMGKTVVLVGME